MLQKQQVPIDFGGGLDTKTDKKAVAPGKFTELKNAVRAKGRAFNKANGCEALAGTAMDGTVLTNGKALAVFNDELLVYDSQRVYAYSEAAGKAVDKGPVVSCLATTRPIMKNTRSQISPDSAILGNFAVYAWVDSAGGGGGSSGVRSSVVDLVTGTPLVADVLLETNGVAPRCMALGSYLYVFYATTGASFKVRRINPATDTAFAAAVTIDTIDNTSANFDVQVQSSRFIVAYNSGTSTAIKIKAVDAAGAVLVSPAATSIADFSLGALCIAMGQSNTAFICYFSSTNGLRGALYSSTLTQLVAPTTIDATTSPTRNHATALEKRDASGFRVYYDVSASGATPNAFVKTCTFSNAGSVSTPAVFLRSVGLASRAFAYYADGDSSDRSYVGVVHVSPSALPLQSTYFVARDDGLIISKMQAGLAYGHSGTVPSVNVRDAGVYLTTLTIKGELMSGSFTLPGIAATTLDFTSDDVFATAQLNQNLVIGGGIIQMYDGQSVVELGFHLAPESITFSQTTGGSLTTTATYQYVAMYEWYDAYGQRHRSAPSVPFSVTLTGTNTKVTATVDTLRLTQKQNTRTNVTIVLFRNEANGGDVFYRVSDPTSPTYNDTTADTVTMPADSLADSSLIAREVLYTDSGEVENSAPPAAAQVMVFKKRIFLIGLEDPYTFWYSKKNEASDAKKPVEFSDLFVGSVEAEGGPLTAAAAMDDKLILFKADRPFVVVGDGPSAAGDGAFSEPEAINIDVGVTDPFSIARTANGIAFKSQKGIYELNGALQQSYIGAGVEDFNDLKVTSAVQCADVSQLRFTTKTGDCLVYDYFFGEWSTFDHYGPALDAVVWRGQYVFLLDDGRVAIETPGAFLDIDGNGFSYRVVTGWMSFAGIQGYQRVYELSFLGDYKSAHQLQVEVAYDFVPDSAAEATVEFDGSAVSEIAAGTRAYRFSAKMKRQKCTSIQLTFEDVLPDPLTGSGEALTLSNMSLIVGVKSGHGRVRGTQKARAT